MPNWCVNYITFTGPAEPIKKLREFISAQESVPDTSVPGHFATNTWLGTFLNRAGLNFEDYECRGQITGWPIVNKIDDDIDDAEEYAGFSIQTETAWGPMIAMWDAIAKQFSNKIEIIYIAEEPGLGVYSTNDPEIRGYFHIEKSCKLDEEKEGKLKGTMFEGYIDPEEYSEDEVRDSLLRIYPDKAMWTTEQLINLFRREYNNITIIALEWYPIEEVD